MVELKNKCEAIERREAERRAVDERKRKEEIDFLKRLGGLDGGLDDKENGSGRFLFLGHSWVVWGCLELFGVRRCGAGVVLWVGSWPRSRNDGRSEF